MRRGATKEQIISTTQQMMAREGIRALRVDQIAQLLGISKRTLYEQFIDKNSLVYICLDQMSKRQHEQIQTYWYNSEGSPLRQAGSFLRSYIASLMEVNGCFLSDINQKVELSERFSNNKSYCRAEFTHIIERCQQQGFLLAQIDSKGLSIRILETLISLRYENATQEELSQFCLIMLRGTSTQKGIDMIDQNTQQS